jgi:hypothetical protein
VIGCGKRPTVAFSAIPLCIAFFHECVKQICEIFFLKKATLQNHFALQLRKVFHEKIFIHRPAILIVAVIMPHKKYLPADVVTVACCNLQMQ